jgi:hypothetical protein
MPKTVIETARDALLWRDKTVVTSEANPIRHDAGRKPNLRNRSARRACDLNTLTGETWFSFGLGFGRYFFSYVNQPKTA